MKKNFTNDIMGSVGGAVGTSAVTRPVVVEVEAKEYKMEVELTEKAIVIPHHKIKMHPRNNEVFPDLEGKEFDDYVKSIKTFGQIKEGIVWKLPEPEGDYEWLHVDGWQRWRGTKEANRPFRAVELLTDDRDIVKMYWIHCNKGRNPTTALFQEEVELLQKMRAEGKINMQGGSSEFIAEKYGKSVMTVKNAVSLGKKLVADIKTLDTTDQKKKLLTSYTKEEQEAFLELISPEIIKELTAKELKLKMKEFTDAQTEEQVNLKNDLDLAQKAVKKNKQDADQKQKKATALEGKLGDKEDELVRVNAELKELQKEYEKSGSKDTLERLTTLSSEKMKLDVEIGKLIDKQKVNEDEIIKLKGSIKDKSDEINNLKTDYLKLVTTSDDLKEKLRQKEEAEKKNTAESLMLESISAMETIKRKIELKKINKDDLDQSLIELFEATVKNLSEAL